MKNHPKYQVFQYALCGINESHPIQIANFYSDNKLHLANSMPIRPAEFYEESYWSKSIRNYHSEFQVFTAFRLVVLDQIKVIATINCDQIVRGPFQACYLGYCLDKQYEGKGIIHHSLKHIINYLFDEKKINRIMANYIPNNNRSENVLQKLGFEKEGYAKNYLKINGLWQDHILTSLVNKECI